MGFSVVLVLAILFLKPSMTIVLFRHFKVAGYTIGPLLGLFTFGIFTKWNIKDRLVPIVAVLSPIIAYHSFTFLLVSLLMVNGGITFFGLCPINQKSLKVFIL